ncbi:hypothetical protein [Oceanivirga salmonicida]|uniref:hypothetical protein n=1 Tax=Oceanivirga salmonicida TaxID=1769291 RepID=UPI00082CE15D|nr:hypothetical protein [Oceanivirga salmonicida]
MLISELVVSILIFLKINNLETVSILLLTLNLLLTAVSIFISINFIPFYILLLAYKYYPYINIIYLVITIILLLGYVGIDDNFKSLHKKFVGLFFLTNSLGLIVLF